MKKNKVEFTGIITAVNSEDTFEERHVIEMTIKVTNCLQWKDVLPYFHNQKDIKIVLK